MVNRMGAGLKSSAEESNLKFNKNKYKIATENNTCL